MTNIREPGKTYCDRCDLPITEEAPGHHKNTFNFHDVCPTPNSPELLAKEWKFKCWYKERFSFTNGTDTLEFTPYFRSDIDPVMTLRQIIAEGCEDIEINNVPLGLSGEQEDINQ